MGGPNRLTCQQRPRVASIIHCVCVWGAGQDLVLGISVGMEGSFPGCYLWVAAGPLMEPRVNVLVGCNGPAK